MSRWEKRLNSIWQMEKHPSRCLITRRCANNGTGFHQFEEMNFQCTNVLRVPRSSSIYIVHRQITKFIEYYSMVKCKNPKAILLKVSTQWASFEVADFVCTTMYYSGSSGRLEFRPLQPSKSTSGTRRNSDNYQKILFSLRTEYGRLVQGGWVAVCSEMFFE